MTVRFSREELKRFSGKTLPDLISHEVRLLFVGINPGLRSVAVQAHFAPRGNRFYPALFRAGITDRLIDASVRLRERRPRIPTATVESASPASSSAPPQAQPSSRLANSSKARRNSAKWLRSSRRGWSPSWGSPPIEPPSATLQPSSETQPSPYPASELWVVPNPSGRNAHAPLAGLAAAYGEAARAAGISVDG